MNVLWFILIAPGVVAAYLMIVRPILHAVPIFKRFYDSADTF